MPTTSFYNQSILQNPHQILLINTDIYIYILSMHANPEAIQLGNIFTQLDKDKLGYITSDQFQAYISQQPKGLPQYLINDLFNYMPQGRMNQKSFVTYMMGYRMNLQQLAISRFAMEKQLSKHASASPPTGQPLIRKNSLKFSVASKKNLSVGQKHKFSVGFGKNDKAQQKRFQEFKQILGRQPEDIVALIKFRADGAQQQIRSGIETIIQTAKGIFTQLDQQVSRIIDLFKFTVKAHHNFVYIIVEVNHVFLIDTVHFIHELIQSLSSDALLEFSATLRSNYLKDFLKEGAEKKLEDVQAQLCLNVDDQSMKKVKSIVGNQAQFNSKKDQFSGILFLLFQQVTLEAQFANSQKLFNQIGISNQLAQSKQGLVALKQMSLIQTIQGFVPEAGKVIENIKKHGKGQGQISINLKNIYAKVEFQVQIEGIFDLF